MTVAHNQDNGMPTPPPPIPMPPKDDSAQSNTGDDNSKKEEEEEVVPIGNFGVEGDFKTNIHLPEHETEVDEVYFLSLLIGSISLNIEEKKKIVENFGTLNQFQVDELIKIFEEEKSKFSALDVKHKEQLEKLQKQHMMAWNGYESNTEQKEESVVEEDEAEDIRKSLGL